MESVTNKRLMLCYIESENSLFGSDQTISEFIILKSVEIFRFSAKGSKPGK